MLLLRAVLNMLVRKRACVFQVPDVEFVRTLWVVIFALFYCILDLSCGEYNGISLYLLCFSVHGYICLVCCVSDSVCELFSETIRNIFGCGCDFIVEGYGSVECWVWMKVLCWIYPVWYSKECVGCACDHGVHIHVHSIGCVCRKVSPHLRVW